jgi:hypothetical protein
MKGERDNREFVGHCRAEFVLLTVVHVSSRRILEADLNDLFAIVVIATAAKSVYQITVLGSVTTAALYATRLQDVETYTLFEALRSPFIMSD